MMPLPGKLWSISKRHTISSSRRHISFFSFFSCHFRCFASRRRGRFSVKNTYLPQLTRWGWGWRMGGCCECRRIPLGRAERTECGHFAAGRQGDERVLREIPVSPLYREMVVGRFPAGRGGACGGAEAPPYLVMVSRRTGGGCKASVTQGFCPCALVSHLSSPSRHRVQGRKARRAATSSPGKTEAGGFPA